MKLDLALYLSAYDEAKHPRDPRTGEWIELLSAMDPSFGRALPTSDLGVVRNGDDFTINPQGKHQIKDEYGHPRASSIEEAAAKIGKYTATKPGDQIVPGMDITPLEHFWIGKYQDASWNLNRSLWNDKPIRGRAKRIDNKLQAIMAKNHTPKKQTLWRSVETSLLPDYQIGDVILNKGYTSTAHEPKGTFGIGDSYAMVNAPRTLLKIEVPKGTPFSKGAMEWDDETILNRGSRFEVVGFDTWTHRDRGVMKVVKLKLLPEA